MSYMSPTLRVAAAQIAVTNHIQENVKTIIDTVVQTAAQEADLVLFPETSISDYSPVLGHLRDPAEWPTIQQGLEAIAGAAREHCIWVIVGTDAWDEGWHNRLYVFDEAGETVTTYDKVHLTSDDCDYYQPGNAPTLFDLNGIPVGLQICYDVRFPEGYRELLHQGAQVILQGFYGAGSNTWKYPVMNAHIRGRAAESGCFLVTANVAGPLQIVASMIVDPQGLVLAQANQDWPQVLLADLDLSLVGESTIRRDYLQRFS